MLASTQSVALITGGATVVAAFIIGCLTALFAHMRLGRQLKSSADQQQLALDAEAQRQEAALAHDRELADLEDLRKLLDEAAIAIAQARALRSSAIAGMKLAGLGSETEVESWVEKTANPLQHAQSSLTALSARLRVRLGGLDEITTALSSAADALGEVVSLSLSFHFVESDNRPSLEDQTEQASKRFLEAAESFHNAAVTRAGTFPVRRAFNRL
jgi:multidrug efflux pump subunit AcrB